MRAVFHKKTTLLIATAALALTGPAHAQVIFNASFNDQPLGPLATGSPPDLPQSIITDTGATVEVVASAGDLTDKPVVLHSVPGSLACAAFYSPSVLIAGDWRLSWDSLVLDTPADDPPEQAHVLLGGGTETMWGIKYLPNGQFSVEDAGGFHSVGSFAVGRSSHFDLDLHLDRSTYELSVNNQRLLSGGLKASRQFDLTYFRSNGRTGSQLPLMAFDNVQVQSAPAIAHPANDGFDPNPNGIVDAIAIQPDGKIIIGGEFDAVGSTGRSRICRLNVDGTVDTSFNAGTISSWGSFLFIGSIVVQADGKIVVGGNFNTMGGQERNYIARLNADGSLDDSFDPEADFVVYTLALQADGKILAGGIFTTLGGQPRDGIGRLNADGSLDSTFNPQATGIAKAGFYALAVQADGKIVVGGLFTSLVGQPRANIGRLNADGSLDTAFNPEVGGNVFNPYVGTLAVQADGKIVVGGRFTTLADQLRNNLGRLNANGTLDTTFNPGATDGPVDPPYTMVERLAVQADGKILVGGNFTRLGGQPRNRIGRLKADGSLDASFNPGVSGGPGGINPTAVTTMALQADGKLVVGGPFATLGDKTRHFIGRLNVDGSVDTTLNPGADDWVSCVAMQPDGRVVVAGRFTGLQGQVRNYLGRFSADGTLDSIFNPGASFVPYSVAVQGDGKILVGGVFATLGGQPRLGIGRLNPDGSLDNSFNPGASNEVYSLILQPDGKILVGGLFTALAGQPRANIGRLNADGSLDVSFNPGADDWVTSLALQADGKILVGGRFRTLGRQPRNAMGRLNADGSLDTSFNPGPIGGGAVVFTLAVQADGKILAGGWFTTLGGQPRNRLGRLNADGTVDATFNPGASGGPNPAVYSMVVQTDGKIVVGGPFTTLAGQPRDNIGRLNPDGSADTAFNPGANAEVASLAVQPDGKILVGGFFTTLGGEARNFIGRLASGSPALQTLTLDASGTTVIWNRSGSAPEVQQVTFEKSIDDLNYTLLGAAVRISGGWRLTGLTLPPGQNVYLRARGRTVGGYGNNSGGLIESVAQFYIPARGPNHRPVVAPVAPQTVNEGVQFSVSISATDPDLPADRLTFSLAAAPPGAAINPTNGFFTWTPSEEQGPGTNWIQVIVTDDGAPSLSATQGMTVVVNELNSAPRLLPVSNQAASVLTLLRVTNVVADPDVPTNRMTFRLAEGPVGARINTNSGVFSWTPSRAQAGSSNFVMIVVTDDGVPPLSVTNSFSVLVSEFVELTIGAAVLRAGESGTVPISVLSSVAITNLSFLLEAPEARLANLALQMLPLDIGGNLALIGSNRSFINYNTSAGQPLAGLLDLGTLAFTTRSNQSSASVALNVANLTAKQSDGALVPRTMVNPGRVVVVGSAPFLEALFRTNRQPTLTLYGTPQTSYRLESTTNWAEPRSWRADWQGTLTNLFQVFTPSNTNQTIFYRARE